jgi:PAS domain S-box-containing protein
MTRARSNGRRIGLVTHLQAIGGDVEAALESINVPSYVVDRSGVVRWLNKAARRLVGDVRGRQFTSVVAPEETRRAREVFARNISGPHGPTDSQVVVIGADGERVGVELSSVPLMQGDRVIGVFGQVADVEDSTPRVPHPHLTPRQTEVLGLLEQGRSTDDIAAELQLSIETVRNHIRHILRALGVHSRLQAVAISRRQDLVPG